MKIQKILKLALPALLLSALVFEWMPGSVRYYTQSAEAVSYHFFNIQTEHPTTGYLILAGYATIVAVILALVAAFSKKRQPLKVLSWCCLAAAALTGTPYMMPREGMLLQPNVIVTLLLTACWLIALFLDKNKNKEEATTAQGPRL